MHSQPLDQIVREYLIESGYSTEHKYARFLQIAISGLRELSMDVSGVPKAVHLDIDKSTYTVPLPDDFITHTKIGACSNGNIIYMGFNNNICLPESYDGCTTTTEGTDTVTLLDSSSTNVRNGESIGGRYGLGGGHSFAYYKFDYHNNLILISTGMDLDSIYLEYISDPAIVNGDYVVHPYDVESLKSFIYWKDIQRNKSINGGEKEMAKFEWLRNKMNCRQRHSSFTIQEAYQTIRKANKQAPKF